VAVLGASPVSDDPSPWAEFSAPFQEPERRSTHEMLQEIDAQHAQEAREAQRNAIMIEKYAYRLTADGRLIA